jgi:hypothetical protein
MLKRTVFDVKYSQYTVFVRVSRTSSTGSNCQNLILLGEFLACIFLASPGQLTLSGSLRIFLRARFRANACFTRRLSPGLR